jgi:4-amino-4-deoxychorismate lyase
MSTKTPSVAHDILVNGIKSDVIPATDRGLQYGDGLFETIAINNGKPIYLDQHLARLQKGMQRLGITGVENTAIKADVVKICAESDQAIVKIIVTRGDGNRGYRPPVGQIPVRIVSIYPFPEFPDYFLQQGVKLTVCKTPIGANPVLAGIKHLNRLEQVMARSEWQDPEISEGIMLDLKQNVIEGTMSNIFFVKEGKLHTPSLDQCGVEGIMRGNVISAANTLGLPMAEAQYPLQDFYNAEEVFITNSIICIWPVRQIEQMKYKIGQITQQLIDLIRL